MRPIVSLLMVFIVTSLFLPVERSASAADADIGLDFATAYVFRGTELNNSWVAQPYLELSGFPETLDGLSIGVWGNLDMNHGRGGTPESGQFSEIDFYGSYTLPLHVDPVSLSIGYTEYTYPNSDAEADREAGLVLEIDTFLSPYIGAYGGFDGAIDEQGYFEVGAGYEHELDEEFSASMDGLVAFLIQPDGSSADDGVSYSSLALSLTYQFITASVTGYFETDDKVTQVEQEVVGMLGFSYSF